MLRKRLLIKRTMCLALSIIVALCLGGCGSETSDNEDRYKLNIVTSLFPYYDIVRAVTGDLEGINVELTVSPGQDSHSFEPSPADIIEINNADVFIYNGGSLETWVETTLKSQDTTEQIRMRMMDYVDVLEEEIVEGMDTRFEKEDDGKEGTDTEARTEEADNTDASMAEDENSTNNKADTEAGSMEEDAEEDEHIWTSLVNMQILTEKICEKLCEALPEYEQEFYENASDYIEQLQEVDEEIRKTVGNAQTKEIIFADKFPILYFAKEYGLEYYAAFPGCGSDMEPSAKTIAFLIDRIKEDDIKAVFYLELSSHTVADAIREDTGVEVLQFNSCHNITQKQFDDGITYIDLMKENVQNLKKALQ